MSTGRLCAAKQWLGAAGLMLLSHTVMANKHATDILTDAIEEQSADYRALSTPETGTLQNMHLLTELALGRLTVSDQITPETTDLFGDKIDLNTGGLSLQHTDIAIPGNFPIDVSVQRVFRGAQYSASRALSFGDWQLAVPSIHTSLVYLDNKYSGSWGQNKACSGPYNPDITFGPPGINIQPSQYWSGDTLDIPGQFSGRVLQSTTAGSTRFIKNWKVQCVMSSGVEGFKVTSPSGITYLFDTLRLVPASVVWVAKPNDPYGAMVEVPRYLAFMQVSKISDRFGNHVTYSYANGDELSSISASDGRRIDFVYEMGYKRKRIKSVTVNGQTWQYAYLTKSNHDTLSSVTLPDGRAWQFNMNIGTTNALVKEVKAGVSEPIQCVQPTEAAQPPSVIVHPNGARAEFSLQATLFGRLGVPRSQGRMDICFGNYALVKKTLSGAGLPESTWRYSYSQNAGRYSDGGGSPNPVVALTGLPVMPGGYTAVDLRSTTVVAPDGSKSIHVFDRRYAVTEGQEVASYQYDNDGVTLLSRTERYFAAMVVPGKARMTGYYASDEEFPWDFDTSYIFDNEAPHEHHLNKTLERHYQYEGGTGSPSGVYYTAFSNYNSYGVAGQIEEYNSFSTDKRFTRNTFLHDTTHWLLNLPQSTALSADGISWSNHGSTSYYASNHAYKTSVYQQFRHGQLQSTHSQYHADGNLKLQSVNATNRWLQLENYKRGKPQLIKLPQRYVTTCTNPATCFISASQIVNNNGTVSQITDLNGNITDYQYDVLGRLTRISPKDTRWAATVLSYGTQNGQPTQSISQGNYRKAITYDGLYRPVLTQEWDASVAGSSRFTNQQFNIYNKAIFTSDASTNSTESQGTVYEYDGLQRLVRQYNNVTNLGNNYAYLAGNKTRVTDARGNSSTTTFRAFGSPSRTLALLIEQPGNINTQLSYNLFDNVTAITQEGITESRIYNAQQRLCRLVRPDVGHSAYSYNALGQPIWIAQGASGGAAACNEASVTAAQKVSYSYDNLGAQRIIDYPDTTPDKTYTYDNQGNLKQLIAGNAIWAYGYNSKHLVETESLSLDGKTFSLGWGYNNLGHTSSVTYPGGRAVSYNPNALNQARQAGEYASAISYYPDGQLNQFSFGNGITRKHSLDSLKRLQNIRDYYGSTNYINFTYGYDNNHNVTSITDSLAPQYNLSLGYDNVDRLDSATGQWGSGSFTYDALGNLTRQTLGSFNLNYHYSNNRLTSLSGSQSRSLSYDSRGNITHNGLRSLSFNLANQLTGSGTLSYQYDGHNRLVKRTNSSGSSYHIYSQSGKLMQEHAADGSRTDYIYLANKLIAKVTGSTPTYLHSDALGSPRLETTASRVIQSNSRQHYQPFGQRIPSSNYTDIGFTGHKHDGELGLTYMQQRYYDPLIGRFYSNDPVGFTARNPMLFNRYAYANNNPYKYIDPDGKKAESFFVQGKTYENVGQALSGAWGDLRHSLDSGVQNSIPNVEVTANQLDTASDALAGIAVVATAFGQAEIAGPAALGSTITGIMAEAMGENPVQGVMKEVVSNNIASKTVGTVGKIASGIAANAPSLVKNGIKAADEGLQDKVADGVKEGMKK